jgi:hypothetical protein
VGGGVIVGLISNDCGQRSPLAFSGGMHRFRTISVVDF